MTKKSFILHLLIFKIIFFEKLLMILTLFGSVFDLAYFRLTVGLALLINKFVLFLEHKKNIGHIVRTLGKKRLHV